MATTRECQALCRIREVYKGRSWVGWKGWVVWGSPQGADIPANFCTSWHGKNLPGRDSEREEESVVFKEQRKEARVDRPTCPGGQKAFITRSRKPPKDVSRAVMRSQFVL